MKYGFQKQSYGYLYETDFMGGDFHAIITVSEKGIISGKVIDVMNEEEYAQLRMDNFNGAYTGKVRKEYENLLNKIAETCCTTVLFASDQANRITDNEIDKYISERENVWTKE